MCDMYSRLMVNLEAVINFVGYDGNSGQKLVHLYQEYTTGKWHMCDIVSNEPFSGAPLSKTRLSDSQTRNMETLKY